MVMNNVFSVQIIVQTALISMAFVLLAMTKLSIKLLLLNQDNVCAIMDIFLLHLELVNLMLHVAQHNITMGLTIVYLVQRTVLLVLITQEIVKLV